MRFLSRIIGFSKPVIIRRHSDVAIVANGDNASITYLIDPLLAEQGRSSTCIDTNHKPPKDFAESGYHAAIIVRYLPAKWIKPLRHFHANGGKLIYFMDDDLMDPAAIAGLPRAYAKKVHKLAISQRSKLEALCSEMWVSSAYLAEKYQAWSPKILLPRPGVSGLLQLSGATVCYHGTASHQIELEWLVPVIKSVQVHNSETHFEVFGDHAVNKLYRDMPRVSILHPMSWPNYLSYTASVRHDIALAPLIPHPFNAARGPTKFFDFVRMGAVGIYTDVDPYRSFIRHGVDGLLLPNDPVLWMRAIVDLASDAPRRMRMANAARKRAMEMASHCGDISRVATNI